MTVPSTALLSLMGWMAKHFGFELDLREDRILDPLDENEVSQQLQYGRD
jgi:hypothetical protein